MEKTPSTKHNLDINSISELRGIDSYDLASNTGIWHIPDMPDHVIEKTDGENARFVTISGRSPEAQDHEQLQRYLRRLGETAITGSNLASHNTTDYAY